MKSALLLMLMMPELVFAQWIDASHPASGAVLHTKRQMTTKARSLQPRPLASGSGYLVPVRHIVTLKARIKPSSHRLKKLESAINR